MFGAIGRVVVRWPWLVIAAWIALGAGLTSTLPSLPVLAQRAPSNILPADAPSVVASGEMMKAYKEGGSENILLVVLTNDKGLNAADERVYRDIVTKMKADTKGVSAVQDFISIPALKEVLASKDGKAWLLPVSLRDTLGSPSATAATKKLMDIVRKTVAGTQTTAYLTGPAATLDNVQDIGERDRVRVEVATVTALLLILLMVYRNLLTIMLPLITITVSLVAAQGVVSALGVLGLEISTQTIVLLTAMMAGAGTDYAVFLISRYHDFIRLGQGADDAIQSALSSVGKVITASAATVAVTFLGMIFTKLTVFSTVGVALAVAISVGCAGALTFLPSLLVLVGRRGWAMPSRDLTSRFWRRSGIRIARKPAGHLIASLVILSILAGSVGLARFNYDDRKALPPETESIRGYDAITQHFPLNTSLPQYLLVHSPHDLRTPKALADMEQMAFRITQVPDIDLVRGITRPTGESLEQTKISFQVGEVGSKLGLASSVISSYDSELNLLASGAKQIADLLDNLQGQVSQGIATVRGLLFAIESMPPVQAAPSAQDHLGGSRAIQEMEVSNKLLDAVHDLGDVLGTNAADAAGSFDQSVRPVLDALDRNPACDADPVCVTNRAQLHQTADASVLLDQLNGLARQLQAFAGDKIIGPGNQLPGPAAQSPGPTPAAQSSAAQSAGPISTATERTESPYAGPAKERSGSPSEADPTPTGPTATKSTNPANQPPGPAGTLPGPANQIPGSAGSGTPNNGTQDNGALNDALNSVTRDLQSAGINSPAALQDQLTLVDQGVANLAAASRQMADGVQLIVGQTKQLRDGLTLASQFLLSIKREATTPAMAGFYVPPQILTGAEFKKAAAIFFSPDGHTARYLVQSKLNPFSPEAMDQVNAIEAAARSAQPNTTLSDAEISMSGFSVTLRDTRDYYNHDLRLIVTLTILVVLTILIVLLRALVAPLYLILSVVISYLSALGLGVLTFQFGFHQELHWSVPGLTFIILVAVGADYNLLLISRIRDESPPLGIRLGVIRTITQTGGVITAAGLIFAASMLGLQFSSISTLVQTGFIIGVGILIDTFLVRTITVPATAVLVGKANWWPSKWKALPAHRRHQA